MQQTQKNNSTYTEHAQVLKIKAKSCLREISESPVQTGKELETGQAERNGEKNYERNRLPDIVNEIDILAENVATNAYCILAECGLPLHIEKVAGLGSRPGGNTVEKKNDGADKQHRDGQGQKGETPPHHIDYIGGSMMAFIDAPGLEDSVQTLLGMASVARIREEGDRARYYRAVERQFDQVRSEAQAVLLPRYIDKNNRRTGNPKNARECREALEDCKQAICILAGIRKKCCETLNKPTRPADQMKGAAQTIDDYLSQHDDLTKRLKAFAEGFAGSANAEGFKTATRNICTRLESGTLRKYIWWTFAAATTVSAFLMVVLSGSLLLKNWSIPLVALAAAAAIGFAKVFEDRSHRRYLRSIEDELHAQARRVLGWILPERMANERVFRLAPVQIAPVSSTYSQNGFKPLDGGKARINWLDEYWGLVAKNAGVTVAIVAILLLVSHLTGGIAGADRVFVALKDGEPSCALYRGKALVAIGNRYYVRGPDWDFHELDRSRVASILPANLDTAANMADCSKEKPDTLSASADRIARSVDGIGNGLVEIAGKIPPAVNLVSGCAGSGTCAAKSPVVMVPVFVDNPAHDGLEVLTRIMIGEKVIEKKAVLLPYFSEPVQMGRNGQPGIGSPEDAYGFGRNKNIDKNQTSKVGEDGDSLLLARLGKSLRNCIDANKNGGEIVLEVKGYASVNSLPGFDDKMNWYLAEGRRAAVIRELRQNINHTGIQIQTASGPKSIKEWEREHTSIEPDKFHFRDAKAMNDDLDKWLKQIPGEPSAAREIFARSVVIEFAEGSLKACGN
jgi:hypothetical protein